MKLNEVFGINEHEFSKKMTNIEADIVEILFKSDDLVETVKKLNEWLDSGDRELKILALVVELRDFILYRYFYKDSEQHCRLLTELAIITLLNKL